MNQKLLDAGYLAACVLLADPVRNTPSETRAGMRLAEVVIATLEGDSDEAHHLKRLIGHALEVQS